jgi:beta-phosphoglucomutase
MNTDSWTLAVAHHDPAREKTLEGLFTQANGYLGIRGYTEEGFPGRDRIPRNYQEDPRTLPQQYAAVVFDHSPVTGQTMVNLPTLRLTEITLAGEHLDLGTGILSDYGRSFSLRNGVSHRSFIWTSPGGRRTALRFHSFVSWPRKHVLVTRIEIHPLDWSGEVGLRPCADGSAATLLHHHLDPVAQTETEHGFLCSLRTRTSQIEIGICRQLSASAPLCFGPLEAEGLVTARSARGMVSPETPLIVDQVCAVCASLDREEKEAPGLRAVAQATTALREGFDRLQAEQDAAWARLWNASDVEVDSDDPDLQRRIRFHLFHLRQACRGDDLRLGLGAKFLTGQHYGGHYFWDTEIFLLPFFLYTHPEAARNLLLHRIERLDGARRKAARMGFRGTFYPWEADPLGGEENCPTWWQDEKAGKPVRILCGELELHINSAIVYGLDHYCRVTGDRDFWNGPAAPVVLECARFWASRGIWQDDAFVFRDVIGPDEYHERVDNDAYTNFTARWNLEKALALLRDAPTPRARELREQLGLSATEEAEWARIVRAIRIGYDEKQGVLAQDDAYLSIPLTPRSQLDLSKRQYLFFEPHTLSKMSMIKQASVLAIHHLFPLAFDRALMENDWNFYEPRTVHDSSLSAGSHACLAAFLGHADQANAFYEKVLNADLDFETDHAADGLHAANAGSAWLAAVMAFGGIHAEEDRLWCAPRLPAGWRRLAFALVYRGRQLRFTLTADEIAIVAGPGPAVDLVLEGVATHIPAGATEQAFRRTPHAVIFDLDGVLLDSAQCHYRAWKQIADRLGVPFDEERNRGLLGLSRRDSFDAMLAGSGVHLSEPEIQRLLDEKNSLYREAVKAAGESLLLPGVKRVLTRLRFAGLRVAVASSSRNTPDLMRQTGLDRSFFHAVAHGGDVTRAKPDPKVFELAAARLGCKPEHSVVAEDAPAGAEGAHRAGMRCIGIGHSHLDGVDQQWPSLADMPPNAIFDLLANRGRAQTT